jgi:hypothetical protein
MPSRTPFFAAFGPLLFGRRSTVTLKKVQAIRSLDSLFEMFGDFVPKHFFPKKANGANSRERELPPRTTFWAFVSQILDPGSSCRETVRKVEAWWRWKTVHQRKANPLSASAYSQARNRLDLDTIRLIKEHLAWTLEREVLEAEKWLGRDVRIVDGTGISMPDTPENQARWPQPSSQAPGCGFPQMKLVGLFSLASGALLAEAIGNREHDIKLARQLWSRLKQGDVLLGDRGFCAYSELAALKRRGVDGVFRLHQARHADFRQGKRIGPDDRLVLWKRPAKCPPDLTGEEFAEMPETLQVRLIRLQVAVPGFRTKEVILVTTLIDPEKYPAEEVRKLYGERWQIELHFHQIKVLQQMDVLRCKTPEMIEKELQIHLVAYNLIRCFMQRAAHVHSKPLERISFKGSQDTVRHFATAIHACSSNRKKQDELIAQMLALIASDPVPERPNRSEPRARKRRAKNYQLLTKPRHLVGNLPRRNRPKKPKAKHPSPSLT